MNSPEYLPFALLCFILSFVLFLYSRRLKNRAKGFLKTRISTIKQLLDKKSVGQLVAVSGKLLRADKKLNAPYSQRDCVFFEANRKDLIELRRSGYSKTGQRFAYKLMEELRSKENFFVEDPTGKILVKPDNFKVDGLKIMGPEFKHVLDYHSSLADSISAPGSNAKKIVRQEQILPERKTAYILGWLHFSDNQPYIHALNGKAEFGIISCSSYLQIKDFYNKRRNVYILSILLMLLLGLFFIALAFA